MCIDCDDDEDDCEELFSIIPDVSRFADDRYDEERQYEDEEDERADIDF